MLWEIIERKLHGHYEIPFANNNLIGVQVLINVAKKDLRPTFSEKIPGALRALMNQCWSKDATKRMSSVELLAATKVPFYETD